jgi:penicillin-binding protein 2
MQSRIHPSYPAAVLALLLSIQTAGVCQPVMKALPVDEPPNVTADDISVATPKKDLKAGWQTVKEARAITLSIPAPRGQIVDRKGVPLAQTRVVQYLALNFPFMQGATDAQIISFARDRINRVNQLLGKKWGLSDERLVQHYKNRRWLPLVFSITEGLNDELTSEQQAIITPLLAPGNGLLLQPSYLRYYPKGAFAPHIIGYTGKTRPLPLGPIQDGDSLFEEAEGREGLEKSYDKDLQGKAGVLNVLFNPDGSKADQQTLRRPVPGNNVVTTLDYSFQKYAENALAKHTKGGAMVIMEIKTGDILAMATFPNFDLNLFVPGITSANFQRLNADPMLPLFARSFRGEYPPASTFKVVVAMAGLESGRITAKTSYDCDASFQVGDRAFKNWAKEGEGPMNVVGAIKRSCNTWFYAAGLDIGANPITDMAQRLGFGERTGIPLVESPGFVPTNQWMQQHLGHKMLGGDIANLSIGQGRTLVTPLQAAQAMAAVADGNNMSQARLVSQIQDLDNHVVQVFAPSIKRKVDLQEAARDTVRKGMVAVVNADNGTGKAAQLDDKYHVQLAGKTGTAQWKMNENRHLAWFTGFLPASEPVYAYAVVYEGQPNEEISGGKKAAPIVHEVFDNIFKNASPDEPVLLLAQSKEAPKAIPVKEEDEATDNVPKAMPAEEVAPEAPPIDEKKSIGGFFKRLFGGTKN